MMKISNHNQQIAVSPVYNRERKDQLLKANFTVYGVSLCQRDVERSFFSNEHEEPIPSVRKDKGT